MCIRDRNSSWPRWLDELSAPVTRERRRSNQRAVIPAANVIVRQPLPRPINTPQYATRCHGRLIAPVSSAPAATSSSAPTTTLRVPALSIRAAANGAVRPKSTMFTEAASAMVPRSQPNSSCRGVTSSPGTVVNLSRCV